MIEVSVVIPTCGRPERLGRCLDKLAAQDFDRRAIEILVGVDGPDDATAAVAERAQRAGAQAGGSEVRIDLCPRLGLAGVKSRLVRMARGRLLLFMNDDVYAEPSFVAAHVRAHEERLARGLRDAMILGDSPWLVREPDRLLDRLIRETPMVFFYSDMPKSGPAYDAERDWGFRHAWNLNVSMPTAAVRAVGGFSDGPLRSYGYEDLEVAWRLADRFGMPVLFRPEAVAWHDHPYEPDIYLAREKELGRQARALAIASPDCASAVFGRDVGTSEELAYSRAFVENEAKLAARLLESFRGLADLPASAVAPGEAGRPIMRLIYEQHLLLKRYFWRLGFIEHAEALAGEREAAALFAM